MKRSIIGYLIALLGGSLILSGCGNLGSALAEKAQKYAAGRQEDAYYLQASGYRMKELLSLYTSEYRKTLWEYEDLKAEEEPEGWNMELIVASDACVSSSRELYHVLTEALKEASLGARLQFDRTNFLPKKDDIQEWFDSYVLNHPLDALCLEKVTVYQRETASERILYLVFSYSAGLETVKELRRQTKEAAEEFVDKIGNDMVSEMQKAEAVWEFLTEDVAYPELGDQNDAYYRADGPFLEWKALGQGYAAAACVLLDKLGMEQEVLPMKQEIEDTWRFINRVKIDGIWYQTDHCFGAATKNRDFFLMKEDEE